MAQEKFAVQLSAEDRTQRCGGGSNSGRRRDRASSCRRCGVCGRAAPVRRRRQRIGAWFSPPGDWWSYRDCSETASGLICAFPGAGVGAWHGVDCYAMVSIGLVGNSCIARAGRRGPVADPMLPNGAAGDQTNRWWLLPTLKATPQRFVNHPAVGVLPAFRFEVSHLLEIAVCASDS